MSFRVRFSLPDAEPEMIDAVRYHFDRQNNAYVFYNEEDYPMATLTAHYILGIITVL